MRCTVLIVNNGKSFLIDSILTELETPSITCLCCDYDVKSIESVKDSVDIVILFVGELTSDMVKTLVFIKDICADDSKSLYLAGYENEIAKAKEIVPANLVKKEFFRPFDTKIIVNEMILEAKEVNRRHQMKEILLVDDDVTFLKMVKKWLSHKYNVTVVKSGMQAIKYITTHRPDLILMDYDMPITDGSKVMEMIKSEPDSSDIPVIFLTGKSDKETVMQVMSLKPQGYLLKTMDREKIIEAIDKYFETSKWQNAVNASELRLY